MDRYWNRFPRVPISFPRTGGDGPNKTRYRVKDILLPPHGRGWTPHLVYVNPHVGASPARAGMDLEWVPCVIIAISFPRTGGDGPLCSYPLDPIH